VSKNGSSVNLGGRRRRREASNVSYRLAQVDRAPTRSSLSGVCRVSIHYAVQHDGVQDFRLDASESRDRSGQSSRIDLTMSVQAFIRWSFERHSSGNFSGL